MNSYTFHISLYDLTFLGVILTGLIFALLLSFTTKTNKAANRFLALAETAMVLSLTQVLGIDVGLEGYIPDWSWLPLQFSLGFGPLIYFYVLKITRPDHQFRLRDMLHFTPLLLQLCIQLSETVTNVRAGSSIAYTSIFQQLNPALQLAAFFSVTIYLYRCHQLVKRFYQRLEFNGGDRYLHGLRWLDSMLKTFAFFWLLWIPFIATDYFAYHHGLGIHTYYPLILLSAIIFTRIAVVTFLKTEAGASLLVPPVFRPLAP